LCKKHLIIDEDGESHEIYGRDLKDAALKFAKWYNEGDGGYMLMNETLIITVDGNPFVIGAEPDIYYSAKAK
jgi:hypothetical protein